MFSYGALAYKAYIPLRAFLSMSAANIGVSLAQCACTGFAAPVRRLATAATNASSAVSTRISQFNWQDCRDRGSNRTFHVTFMAIGYTECPQSWELEEIALMAALCNVFDVMVRQEAAGDGFDADKYSLAAGQHRLHGSMMFRRALHVLVRGEMKRPCRKVQ
jgi:hypothetical protein